MAYELNPNEQLLNFMESGSFIQIKEGAKVNRCYKKENIEVQGWCPVEGSDGKYNKWGFCSPSCKHFSNKNGKTRVIIQLYKVSIMIPRYLVFTFSNTL